MPNLALLRAVAWRHLGALRARISRQSGSAPSRARIAAPPAADEVDEDPAWLTPLVVDYFGRDGSTAMLRLLASSPAILVEGGYPYESERLAQVLLSGALPGAAPTSTSARAALADRWRSSSRELLSPRGQASPARYYAEKIRDARRLDRDALPGTRMIVLLRDPRDTLVSIESFSRAVGTRAIGGGDGREEMLRRFIRRQRERLEWIGSLQADEHAIVVDYRALVEDLEALAGRLAGWLEVDLDPRQVARDFRLRWVHGTSPDPRRSVGRWTTELDEATAARLQREIGAQMRAVGFA